MNTFVKSLILTLTSICLVLFSLNSQAALPIKKIPLETGATLYYVEARSIPMVNIGLDINAGSVFEPNGKTGVASLTANLLNKGAVIQGIKRDEAYLADKISDLGAVFSSSANNELTSIRIKSLSKPEILNEVILLSAGMIANPIYDEKVLSRQKTVMISALLDKKADPDYIMSEEFTKMIYQGNPLGKLASEKEIKSINPQDLKKFHQTYYRAKNTNVIIVGDLEQSNAVQIATLLTKQFMRTSPVDLSIPTFKPLPIRPLEERVIKISHPSAQAHIAMGIDSVPRNHPDYFTLLVGNYILGGGGFVSRLMNEIREKRGLAYSVSSYFMPSKYSGFFSASMQTKKEQSNEAVQLLNQTIENYVKSGPTDEEILAAKSNLINGFPLRIDSNNKLLENVSNIAWQELPLDTLDVWTKQVEKVTKEDIQIAFKKYLDAQRMITIVVGGN